MDYDTSYRPTTAEARDGVCYIARWDGDEHDGTAGTYDEREYDDYERAVIAGLDGTWATETDDEGVYLVEVTEIQRGGAA